MDQPPAVALTAFPDAWPRAIETEIGAALCAIGVGRTLTFKARSQKSSRILWLSEELGILMRKFVYVKAEASGSR